MAALSGGKRKGGSLEGGEGETTAWQAVKAGGEVWSQHRNPVGPEEMGDRAPRSRPKNG